MRTHVDPTQAILGKRSFVARLFHNPFGTLGQSPFFLSSESHGTTTVMKLYRLSGAEVHCIWEGAGSRGARTDHHAVIFPNERLL